MLDLNEAPRKVASFSFCGVERDSRPVFYQVNGLDVSFTTGLQICLILVSSKHYDFYPHLLIYLTVTLAFLLFCMFCIFLNPKSFVFLNPFWFVFLRKISFCIYRYCVFTVDSQMSKSGALDLAAGVGGKIKKEDVQSAVDQFVPLLIVMLCDCWNA